MAYSLGMIVNDEIGYWENSQIYYVSATQFSSNGHQDPLKTGVPTQQSRELQRKRPKQKLGCL